MSFKVKVPKMILKKPWDNHTSIGTDNTLPTTGNTDSSDATKTWETSTSNTGDIPYQGVFPTTVPDWYVADILNTQKIEYKLKPKIDYPMQPSKQGQITKECPECSHMITAAYDQYENDAFDDARWTVEGKMNVHLREEHEIL